MKRKSPTVLQISLLLAICAIASYLGTASADITPEPTPISACGALGSGPYVLTKNITTNATCFIVVSGTALDLGGYQLIGAGPGGSRSAYGISDNGSAASNVIISNGTITRFWDGVASLSPGASSGWTINNVTIINNVNFGVYTDSCCNTFTNLIVSDNGTGGIFDDASSFGQGSYNLYTNVVANNNDGFSGIYASGCCNSANNVTANGNDLHGIQFQGKLGVPNTSGNNSIINSTTNSNFQDGMAIDGSNNTFEGTTSNYNRTGTGLASFGGQARIDHAYAQGNRVNGIEASGDDNLITNSVALINGQDGIGVGQTGGNNSIFSVLTDSNGSFGVNINCLGNVTFLSANHNKCADLCPASGNGPCTLLNNNAPFQQCNCH